MKIIRLLIWVLIVLPQFCLAQAIVFRDLYAKQNIPEAQQSKTWTPLIIQTNNDFAQKWEIEKDGRKDAACSLVLVPLKEKEEEWKTVVNENKTLIYPLISPLLKRSSINNVIDVPGMSDADCRAIASEFQLLPSEFVDRELSKQKVISIDEEKVTLQPGPYVLREYEGKDYVQRKFQLLGGVSSEAVTIPKGVYRLLIYVEPIEKQDLEITFLDEFTAKPFGVGQCQTKWKSCVINSKISHEGVLKIPEMVNRNMLKLGFSIQYSGEYEANYIILPTWTYLNEGDAYKRVFIPNIKSIRIQVNVDLNTGGENLSVDEIPNIQRAFGVILCKESDLVLLKDIDDIQEVVSDIRLNDKDKPIGIFGDHLRIGDNGFYCFVDYRHAYIQSDVKYCVFILAYPGFKSGASPIFQFTFDPNVQTNINSALEFVGDNKFHLYPPPHHEAYGPYIDRQIKKRIAAK